MLTIELPNGTQKRVAGDDVAEHLQMLVAACEDLGRELVLTVKTVEADTARKEVRVEEREVARESKAPDKGRVDPVLLKKAMAAPGFVPHAYAKLVGVNPSLVYYHIKALDQKKKKRR